MKYKYGSRRRAGEYERAIAEWWKKEKVFERSVEGRDAENSYVFYDGPPFITGNPHHGTLLSSIVKDAVPRYFTMNGKRVERRWGWDCHGLPAENFVEKQLGITDRRDIGTKWSLEEYITKARESMVANSETWEGVIERIGRWVDFRGAYKTMDKDYMESVWWAFKTLYEKGKIYEGEKVLMYDTKFATPVSKNEVTMDNDAYRTVTDPSVYVKFPVLRSSASADALLARSIKNTSRSDAPASLNSTKTEKFDKPVYLLAWTTTPWTLPGNTALAVNPKLQYVEVEVEGERYIVAEKCLPKLQEKQGWDEWKVAQPVATYRGEELVGLEYEPLFEGLKGEESEGVANRVWGADYVGVDAGTGVVHLAPIYGEEDFELAVKEGITRRHVLDDNGYYLPEVAEKLHAVGVRDTDEEGIEVWVANKFIAKCLEERGVVYRIEYVEHEYPFNPRSGQRIMYRAIPSWFFDVQGSKELMLEKNENINWFPEYLKHGRFAKNIEQAPDWNLSRDRFWATAMPVWKGDKGTVKVVGSYDELYELSEKRLEDYHRPWVDEVEFDIDGEHFVRVDKVLDCWFESGSMPFAQLHYPFENKEKFEKNYPADFIVEYVGQVRAWFYYVHTVNTALFGEEAYKNVITTGTLAGNDGRKMSKSLGNYTDPNELMDKYSADALRFLLLSSPVLSGEDFALLDKDVSDVARKLSMVWNIYDFFTMYASVDNFDSSDAALSDALLARRISNTTHSATPDALPQTAKNAEQTSVMPDAGQLENILDKWIVSRVYELRDEVTRNMEGYNLPDALQPVLPFVDDLSNWFVRRSRRRFWKSEDDGDKQEAYATLHFVLSYLALVLAPFVPFLAEELWQKMMGEDAGSVHLQNWPAAGKVDEGALNKMFMCREIITEGLAMRMNRSEKEDQIKVRQPLASLEYGGEKLDEFYENIVAEEVNVKKVVHGKAMKLDKKLTQELRDEGFARELIRFVQAARKKAGLSVDDRIRLSLSREVPGGFGEMVGSEVLASEMVVSGNFEYDEIVEIGGEKVTISLEKA